MMDRANATCLRTSLRSVRVGRLLVILFAALVTGLLADWVRRDRVFFPKPLPEFKTVPAEK